MLLRCTAQWNFIHQLPSGGSSGVILLFTSSKQLSLLQLNPLFELLCQCRLGVCIAISIQLSSCMKQSLHKILYKFCVIFSNKVMTWTLSFALSTFSKLLWLICCKTILFKPTINFFWFWHFDNF